jgi:DNA-binding CsgD family transcriptional regulator/5-methylcytosine-specific restriction endonuclease McrA
VFVSETREAIAALLEAGLNQNEVAHRLGLANSTVGYHTRALRDQEAQPAPREMPRSRGPLAGPAVTRERVRRLLYQGYPRARIAEMLGIARSTVTYHAGRLGAGIDGRFARRYDWEAISRFYEEGHSVADCLATFGFDRNAWHDAVNRGAITARPARLPLEQLLVPGRSRNRNHLKRRLFEAGLKTRRCESCGLTEWMGKPVPLALHHVNGDSHDHRLENLQILCSNCHSLTDTWSGRNMRRRRPDATGTPSGAAALRS